MGTTPIGGVLPWPSTGNWIPSNASLDGTSTKRAFTFTIPKTGNIDRILVGLGAVTTAETLRVGIETLDSSGNPSGTQYGGSAVGTGTPVTDTPLEITLGIAASATAGDAVAVVVQWDSTQGNLNLLSSAQPPGVFGSGYANTFTGIWSKGATSRGVAAVRYDDGLYYETELAGAYFCPNVTYNSGSTPDEKGNYIIVPEIMSVCGSYCNCDFDGNADVILYDAADTVLNSWTVPAGVRGSNTTHVHWQRFAPLELAKNDIVRIVVKPTSGTSIGFREMRFAAANHLGALSGGTNIYKTSRTDGGSWTEDTTMRFPCGLIIDGFNSGSGGSGGLPLGRLISGGV